MCVCMHTYKTTVSGKKKKTHLEKPLSVQLQLIQEEEEEREKKRREGERGGGKLEVKKISKDFTQKSWRMKELGTQ